MSASAAAEFYDDAYDDPHEGWHDDLHDGSDGRVFGRSPVTRLDASGRAQPLSDLSAYHREGPRTPRRIDRLAAVRAAGLGGVVRPASEHAAEVGGVTRTLPVLSELRALLPGGGLRRGATIAVHTSSVLLALLAAASRAGSWCAVVGLPALSPVAAAEMGIALDRLALVPYPGTEWTTAVAALLDGLDIVVAAPPGPIAPAVAGRLAARARQRGSVLMPAGPWAGADLTVAPVRGAWDGLGAGRGRLRCREMTIQARGRGAAAAPREVTLWLPALEGVLPPVSRPFADRPVEAGSEAGRPLAAVGGDSAGRGGRPVGAVGSRDAVGGDGAGRGGRSVVAVGGGGAGRGGRPVGAVGSRDVVGGDGPGRGGRSVTAVGGEGAGRGGRSVGGDGAGRDGRPVGAVGGDGDGRGGRPVGVVGSEDAAGGDGGGRASAGEVERAGDGAVVALRWVG